uniref:Protein TsetseEP domain-containing protein n=1 Tax=Bactrocera latifrons TaxID=174628 RepID=A0A0K8WIB5_BACLA
MKFATSALLMVVMHFAVNQASVLPAAQLHADKFFDGVDSAIAASKSVRSADSQPREVSTDIIPTSSPTGVETDSDCLDMYTQSIVALSSKKQIAFNNIFDCVSQGNSYSVCDGKFGSTIKEINSRISALNQKFQKCLKHLSS